MPRQFHYRMRVARAVSFLVSAARQREANRSFLPDINLYLYTHTDLIVATEGNRRARTLLMLKCLRRVYFYLQTLCVACCASAKKYRECVRIIFAIDTRGIKTGLSAK